MIELEICDGKYTVLLPQEPHEKLSALRYGEPWRDLVGDNLVHGLAVELYDAKREIEKLKAQCHSNSQK